MFPPEVVAHKTKQRWFDQLRSQILSKIITQIRSIIISLLSEGHRFQPRVVAHKQSNSVITLLSCFINQKRFRVILCHYPVLQRQIYAVNESIGAIQIKTYFLKAIKIPLMLLLLLITRPLPKMGAWRKFTEPQ